MTINHSDFASRLTAFQALWQASSCLGRLVSGQPAVLAKCLSLCIAGDCWLG